MSHIQELNANAVLHKPQMHRWAREGVTFYVDGQSPNWISTDEKGAQILDAVDGRRTVSEITRLYAELNGLDAGKAWLHAHTFLRDAMRRGVVSPSPMRSVPYEGRSRHMKPERLNEFWIHLTQTCNLSCTHCLVSSGPDGERGLDGDLYRRAIQEAADLGARRFYFTGGEPFARKDIFDLIHFVTEEKGRELIVLTNATLLSGERLEKLKTFKRDRLKFQVSLDGVRAETNDAIRGAGVFAKASEGLKALSGLGFEVSLTAVVTRSNLAELGDLPQLAKTLGAKSVHLMWLHKRGRMAPQKTHEASAELFPSNEELLELSLRVKRQAETLGIVFDNAESIRLRANGQPGVKYDLGNLCWESLCLYMDGHLYPSAATAGHNALRLGELNGKTLKDIWLQSPVAHMFRQASVAQKVSLSSDPFRYLTGGGDVEHSYFFSSNGKEGSVTAEDPYYSLYAALLKEAMWDFAEKKKAAQNHRTGFDAPVILHAMGDDAVACSEDAQGWLEGEGLPAVRLLHSNCVLAFDVEKPYKAVQKFYGAAAEKPQAELCCPVKYDDADVGHIPQEVLDRFYGCGSPISQARVQPGETVLDLGSGAGIDCFIAAKKVGAQGKVIGVDMTAQMLEVALRCKSVVAGNLGYDVVDFRRGYLEKIPTEDRSVDVVTSNCVINLSPDKRAVFKEIWRILKDHGRLCVADIVADRAVPLSLQAHQDLWGECISGSLSEEEFLAGLEREGFYGLSILRKSFWKEVKGVKFYSLTVQGFKFQKKQGCRFVGQKAVYLGPLKAAVDEEGHLFPRGEAVEVCTDTAAKLRNAPYASQFAVFEVEQTAGAIRIAVNPSDDAAQDCCAPGCC